MNKKIRQILASPFLLLGLLFSGITSFIYGNNQDYYNDAMQISKDLHKLFSIKHNHK